MIFVTVGTHEQQFNRLISAIDELKGENIILDDVVIQRGYSTYTPKFCKCYDLLSYEDMDKYVNDARIVITHGGPASFLSVIASGKTPIVVPRQEKYDEHVNNHQLDFTKQLVARGFPIVVVEEVEQLPSAIENVEKQNDKIEILTHNDKFIKDLNEELNKLFG